MGHDVGYVGRGVFWVRLVLCWEVVLGAGFVMLEGCVWVWFVVMLGGACWGHVGGHIERAHLVWVCGHVERAHLGMGLWSCWEGVFGSGWKSC